MTSFQRNIKEQKIINTYTCEAMLSIKYSTRRANNETGDTQYLTKTL